MRNFLTVPLAATALFASAAALSQETIKIGLVQPLLRRRNGY